jgi:hypothetical protein
MGADVGICQEHEMTTPILLPPLPVHTLDREEVYSGIAVNKVCTVLYYTADQMHARDLEVARLVLEAAEQVADACTAARIRNIEVNHHE